MAVTIEPEIDELLERLSTRLKEIPNGKERIIQEDMEGLELVRFDSTSSDYHLRPVDADVVEQQYQAFLTDPRRI